MPGGYSAQIQPRLTRKGKTMKHSMQRILTTHVGSLARTDALLPLLRLKEQGQPYDREELGRLVREAVTDVVRKQVEAGIDIITDGEQGKSGFFTYVIERFNGFERKLPSPGKEMRPRSAGREYLAFPDYYAWSERRAAPLRTCLYQRSLLRTSRLRLPTNTTAPTRSTNRRCPTPCAKNTKRLSM